MLTKIQKDKLRMAMRTAIRQANMTWAFSCYDCKHCVEDVLTDAEGGEHRTGNYDCIEDVLPVPSKQQVPGPFLPTCFQFDYAGSLYGRVLDYMQHLGLEFHKVDFGWGTYVIRVIRRCSRFGHLMNVKKRNLEKYE
ncbi:MAG: hypothetical protein GY934_09680 [Gammaproteobacteria bacterium]|nr:hypothetical protein [Gammaproteobacteria bacterium]